MGIENRFNQPPQTLEGGDATEEMEGIEAAESELLSEIESGMGDFQETAGQVSKLVNSGRLEEAPVVTLGKALDRVYDKLSSTCDKLITGGAAGSVIALLHEQMILQGNSFVEQGSQLDTANMVALGVSALTMLSGIVLGIKSSIQVNKARQQIVNKSPLGDGVFDAHKFINSSLGKDSVPKEVAVAQRHVLDEEYRRDLNN